MPIVYGPGRIEEIGSLCNKNDIFNPLIVTDRGSRDLPFIHSVQKYLHISGTKSLVFSDISPNPKDYEIALGKAAFNNGSHDAVIAIGGGSAGHHVARILLVTRTVGDDELAVLGGEEAIGHIDGDALFAFCGKAIDEQGEVDLLALRAHALAVVFERGKLVLEDHLRIVEQAADERGLPIINAAAGDEAQH